VRDSLRAEFEEFAQVRAPELSRAAWLLTGNPHSAEDLVQETLARVYERWPRVRRTDNPVAYTHTVMFRRYVDTWRRRSRTELLLPQLPEAPASAVPDVGLRLTLVAALRELGAVDRAVLVQRFLLDLDVDTVADNLHLSNQAVRSRSSRALARVRDTLGDEFLAHHLSEEGSNR